MNRKQVIALTGICAYIVGGTLIVLSDLEIVIDILRNQRYLLAPIYRTFSFIVVATIAAVYFLRDKKKQSA